MKNAHVHRFGEDVAVSLPGNGETAYMHANEARRLGRALIAAARDVDSCRFVDSQFRGEDVALTNGGKRTRSHVFYLQHGHGTAGPFRTEAVDAREEGGPQKRRGTVTACRFVVRYAGRWRRLYSDHRPGLALPHFIVADGERIAVSGVCP